MHPEHLVDRLLDIVARDRIWMRRTTRYFLPLLLLPTGVAVAQLGRGTLGLIIGTLSTMVLLVQAGIILFPLLERTRRNQGDVASYLGIAPEGVRPSLAPAVVLALPSALTVLASMVLFGPPILAGAEMWQRLLALAAGLVAIWAVWQPIARIVEVQARLEAGLQRARGDISATAGSGEHPATLLDPVTLRRVAGLPLPPLPFSPAAHAVLRVEAYLMLHADPSRDERELLAALNGLAHDLFVDEQRHVLLPPVGGKVYLPVSANGPVAAMLGATARGLGMDGAYSASLGTWLVRLPPARSYQVAGRLLDALLALGLFPRGALLPHHLTVQGDLGREACALSLLHLAATPVVLEDRASGRGDERPFIMRGGGVLDDLNGRGRLSGPRTDFVDGFLVAGASGFSEVEHLVAHTINLRLKQVLAYGLLAHARRPGRADAAAAAARYRTFRDELRAFLAGYGLAEALDVDWLDGRWSDVWPFLQRMSDLKSSSGGFLDEAQALRNRILDDLETLATKASGVRA